MASAKYKIYSLGCKVNQYDGEKLGGLLESAGFIFGEKDADLAIINTCAVTKSAIKKSRQMIARVRKENPRAKIVVAGCWPKVYTINKKQLKVDRVFVAKDFKNLNIKNYLKITCPPWAENYKIKNSKRLLKEKNSNNQQNHQERSRYFLKIQDGCEQFCAYCIIPYVRGKLQSRPAAEILKEAQEAVDRGYKEIILSGIHLGLFGVNNVEKDKEEKINLTGLLKKLVKIKNLERIRLSSIEITEVTDELISFMKKNKKMCRHLHISLQSGCDKILKLMRRPYDTKYFSARIKKIRQAMPSIAISTDIIIGFPGETKNDFEETCKFAKKIKFSRLHVFSFSAHEKTPAFKMPGQVAPMEIKSRSLALRKISAILEKKYRDKFRGKILEALVQNKKSGKIKARTEYYFDVEITESKIKKAGLKNIIPGELIKIKI